MKKHLLSTVPLAMFVLAVANPAHGAGLTTLSEGFNDINTLSANGWAFQNNSNPAPLVTTPTANWSQGNTSVFTAQSGSANSYIAVDVDSTGGDPQTGVGQVNNWLITPELELSNGGYFSFYTRTYAGAYGTSDNYLEVRQSNNGASTNVGSTPSDFGDFSILRATVGSLDGSVIYPGSSTNTFGFISFFIAPTTGSGRLAFRYYAPNGGGNGLQGTYTGIDTVSYGFIDGPPVVTPEPSSALGLLTLGGFGFAASRRGKSKKVQA
jgi:hypothetical protein